MTDIEKAIVWFENQNKYYDDKEAYQEDYRMNNIALAALREQQERAENKSLTLDELKQMDGEPVWVGSGIMSCWAITGKRDSTGIVLHDKYCDKNYMDNGAWELYGKTWFAYRHKPQEAT